MFRKEQSVNGEKMILESIDNLYLMNSATNINTKNTAIISLAWPSVIARGPEKIWVFLKKIGIMKNLNFRIGHAAMLIAKNDELFYYDLGRYISPLGYSRVRSMATDPKLKLYTHPIWSETGEIMNIVTICQELEEKKNATHGDGPIYLSIANSIVIDKILAYTKSLQKEGFQKYGVLKKSKINCAKFVAKAILQGLDPKSKMYKTLNNPITYSQSPYFNILAASSSGSFFIYENGNGEWKKEKKIHALKELWKKSMESFFNKKAKLLPSDKILGQQFQPLSIPKSMNLTATYLGGIGEGAWHELILVSEKEVCLNRYYYDGTFEFTNNYIINSNWADYLNSHSVELVHDSHNLWITLMNKETKEKMRFFAVNCAEEWKM